jgi:hypothetical protein
MERVIAGFHQDEFVEHDSEHQTWKQAVLAGDVTLAEVDTSPVSLPAPAALHVDCAVAVVELRRSKTTEDL